MPRAGTNRVCGRCLALKDTVVGRTDESGVTLPPLHPRCRCAIMYREDGEEKKPRTDALAAPPIKPNNSTGIVSPPFSLGACKTFEEFKLYWADNYNVKVSEELGKLDFKSVQTAATGIEAVLKGFPPAGFHLKEFNVLRNSAVMSTARGLGKIYFNPDYFTEAETLAATIAAGVKSGFYPANMTPFGAGAHEAVHIVEDWLIEKYNEHKDTKLRIVPTKIIQRAYMRAMKNFRTVEEFKSLDVLRAEICGHALKYNTSECLADGGSDYMTNKQNSALLSRMIWEVLKGELIKMVAFGKLKIDKYPIEEFKKYGLFDDMYEIIGVKEDAPTEFKEAYEEYRAHCEKMEELGID